MNYIRNNKSIIFALVTCFIVSNNIVANDVVPLADKQQDMRQIMEHPIRQLFRFPSEVKFRDVLFSYRSELTEIGVKGKASDLYETAQLCGYYSATNAMAVSGKYEMFYASLYIDNGEKTLDGEIWIVVEGEFKYSNSLDNVYLLSTEEDKFYAKWGPMCGGLEKSYMGAFSSYEFDFLAPISVQSISEVSKELNSPEIKKHFGNCLEGGFNFETCLTSALCDSGNDYGDSCSEPLKLCAGDMNNESCWTKLEENIK